MNREKLLNDLKYYDGPPLSIMEVCGTHTSVIVKGGLRSLLSSKINLVSGPGCPVCVTPTAYIDKLVELCLSPGTCVLSFGDMLRVPGSHDSLDTARSKGGQVKLITSPLEALELAKKYPGTVFIVAAVGFETTLPSYALLLDELGEIKNVKLLTSLKAIVPALEWICENSDIDGFLCPGHVAVITGDHIFQQLTERFNKPFVIAGFDSEAVLIAIWEIISQCKKGSYKTKNLYPSVVSHGGNSLALELIDKYFMISSVSWRGIGELGNSGFVIREPFSHFDAGKYPSNDILPNGCLCGKVVLGLLRPEDCPLFGNICTPQQPVGPCMVAYEGACGISYGGGEQL